MRSKLRWLWWSSPGLANCNVYSCILKTICKNCFNTSISAHIQYQHVPFWVKICSWPAAEIRDLVSVIEDRVTFIPILKKKTRIKLLDLTAIMDKNKSYTRKHFCATTRFVELFQMYVWCNCGKYNDKCISENLSLT